MLEEPGHTTGFPADQGQVGGEHRSMCLSADGRQEPCLDLELIGSRLPPCCGRILGDISRQRRGNDPEIGERQAFLVEGGGGFGDVVTEILE